MLLLALLACRSKDLLDSGVLLVDSVVDSADSDRPDDTGCDEVFLLYRDADGDGYGAGPAQDSCVPLEGFVEVDGDCDDAIALIHPGAEESDCTDPVDYNCDGSVGYVDGDGDGHAACVDCDDADAAVNLDATEVCNDVDDDCDGLIDDQDDPVEGTSTWYADTDGDGLGDPDSAVEACDAPAETVADATDCDDGSGDVGGATTWYSDTDGDGFGDATATAAACEQPSGFVSDATDCDDASYSVNPDADELCGNKTDDDCDGSTDEDDAIDATTWTVDADGDGYADSSGATTVACEQPSGYASVTGDCDDADSGVNPGATEVCDGIDQDCDGDQDDGNVCPCDVEYYGGDAYLFCETASPWTTAQSTCSGVGYHMLTVDDATENAWADSTADTYSTGKWWIGFNDRTTEGTWVWESGSSSTYTNWRGGEPNDSGGNEDCAQLNRYTDQTWNDEPCSSSFRFICEAN